MAQLNLRPSEIMVNAVTHQFDNKLKSLLERIVRIQNYYFEEVREFDLPLDINQLNTSGDTAIHVAAMQLDPSDILLLIENGADVNAIGEFGATPLHCAALTSRLDNFVTLLKSGADHNIRMYQGLKPIDMIIDKADLKAEFLTAIRLYGIDRR